MGDVDVSALIASLERIGHRASDGAQAAAEAMADGAEQEMQRVLRASSHARGTRTPSPPGSPPSRVSGALARSVRARTPFAIGRAKWEAHTASGIAYARIHEVGGWTGRNHASYLPPRPYVAPTLARLIASGRLDAWARAAFVAEVGL